MLHRLILKVTTFQLSPPTCLSTVVKNILEEGHACQIGLKDDTTELVANQMYNKLTILFNNTKN